MVSKKSATFCEQHSTQVYLDCRFLDATLFFIWKMIKTLTVF